ncbi:MAG: hypothetical protein R2861_12860 [Desulfobacterales bacterium]
MTSRVGFDWDNPESVLEKIKEETRELEAAMAEKTRIRWKMKSGI